MGNYKNFGDFIKSLEEEQINYRLETLYNYEKIYKSIKKYRKNNFKKRIKKEEVDSENIHIDDFCVASNIIREITSIFL